MIRAALLSLLLAACTAAGEADDGSANAAQPQSGARTLDLPGELREVSGLAVASPTSVFAHNDERPRISEIELATGRVLRSFAFGSIARDDFEGVAVVDGRIFVITSYGILSSFAPAADGAEVQAEVQDSGAGARCEVEGLSASPRPGELLILCKNVRGRGNRGRLLVLRWTIAANRLEDSPWLDSGATDALSDARTALAPSSIDWDPRSRRVAILAARQHLLLLLDENGREVERRPLDEGRHPQAEGVAIMPSGEVVVADEGGRERPGRLTVYSR